MDTTAGLTPRQLSLLAFIADAGPRDLDPVRIMKGQFLIAKEAPDSWLPLDDRYQFEPYHYGPYAPAVYADLDLLEARGLVRSSGVPGKSWKYYSLTEQGADAAKAAVSAMPPGLVGYLGRVRAYVTQLTFSQLLEAVYARYPEYAINSVFKRKES